MRQTIINEILRPANLLSLSRVPLGVVVFILLGETGTQSSLWALGLLIIAGVTDFLDGYVARISLASGAVPSSIGEALDPIADKLFAALVIVGLIQFREFPLWLAGVIVGRDLLILAAGVLIARRRRIVVRSNLPGKYYFASLAVLMACYVARFKFGIALYTYVTLAFWLWSAGAYVVVFIGRSATQTVSESNSVDRIGKSGAQYRLIATLSLSTMTLYYLFHENPLGW